MDADVMDSYSAVEFFVLGAMESYRSLSEHMDGLRTWYIPLRGCAGS